MIFGWIIGSFLDLMIFMSFVMGDMEETVEYGVRVYGHRLCYLVELPYRGGIREEMDKLVHDGRWVWWWSFRF
jgi:hypothetical protein